jgi:hypothetical protein
LTPEERKPKGMRSFAGKEGIMDTRAQESLRIELVQLLRKQKDTLDARSAGAANEGEVVDYELRQEVIHDICQILANSSES